MAWCTSCWHLNSTNLTVFFFSGSSKPLCLDKSCLVHARHAPTSSILSTRLPNSSPRHGHCLISRPPAEKKDCGRQATIPMPPFPFPFSALPLIPGSVSLRVSSSCLCLFPLAGCTPLRSVLVRHSCSTLASPLVRWTFRCLYFYFDLFCCFSSDVLVSISSSPSSVRCLLAAALSSLSLHIHFLW